MLVAASQEGTGNACQAKIWIDLDNSPHVPFFVPIIEELRQRKYSVLVTARDCAQVFGLVDFFHLNCKRIGRQYRKNKLLKLVGLCCRAVQMAPYVAREKPDLALSHGSRSQLLLSALLGIPSLAICDYEHANQGVPWVRPRWVMVPDIVPQDSLKVGRHRVLRYPGIKEDVYVPRFKADPHIKDQLGLASQDLVVTLRPPASEAHYHNPQSDGLFCAVVDFLSDKPNVRMILLPRSERQARTLRALWPTLFASRKIIIPERVIDGLNLIWHSDLVISGGGTMNREAAALGVPVYSIFRGKLGAVDRYLATEGRLTLLETVEDVCTKIKLVRRHPPNRSGTPNKPTLEKIIENIVAVLNSQRQVSRQRTG